MFSTVFFIVWTEGHQPLYEKIEFDQGFCDTVVNNLKSYVLPCLLGFRQHFHCPKCEKLILEEDEVNEPANEGKVSCVECKTWWHLVCAELHQDSSTWLCYGCLIDTAKTSVNGDESSDENDSDLDTTTSTSLATTFQGPSTSESNSKVCGVCMLSSIPVGGEHICTQCGSAVHAWCSNHENTSSSADLICNFCGSL